MPWALPEKKLAGVTLLPAGFTVFIGCEDGSSTVLARWSNDTAFLGLAEAAAGTVDERWTASAVRGGFTVIFARTALALQAAEPRRGSDEQAHTHARTHAHTRERTQAPRPRGTQQNLDAGRKTDLFDRSAAPAADGAATNCRTCVNDSAHSCPDTSRGMGGADLVSVPDPEPEPEPEPEPAAGTSVTEAAWTLYTCSEWTADILAFRPAEFGSVTLGAFTSLAQHGTTPARTVGLFLWHHSHNHGAVTLGARHDVAHSQRCLALGDECEQQSGGADCARGYIPR